MKLFLIGRADNSWDYDQFDAFVVAARNEVDAKFVVTKSDTWPVEANEITAEFVGTAKPSTKRGVILGSFHAG